MGKGALGTLAAITFGAGLAAYGMYVDKSERSVPEASIQNTDIFADVTYSNYKPYEQQNIFQDRLGVEVFAIGKSNGVHGGSCSYSAFVPASNPIVYRELAKDQENGITTANSYYNITVKDPVVESGGLFTGKPYVAPSCGIRITSYGEESIPSPQGSQAFKIDARSYTGTFAPREKVTLFNGDFTLRVNPVKLWPALVYRGDGVCNYTATFGGESQSVSAGLHHFASPDGKTYRVDARQTAGGFAPTSECRIKVTQFERFSERSVYTPLDPSLPVRGPLSREEQIAQNFVDRNPALSIRYGAVVETVLLQPRSIITLPSDAVHYQENSTTFQTEVAWELGNGNQVGGSVGTQGSLLGLFGSVNGTFERSITRSAEAKVQSGTTRTGGVNLDGSQCRVWETWVEGRRREAFATAPEVGLTQELRFTFTQNVMMYARPLCDSKGKPLPIANDTERAPPSAAPASVL